MLEFCILLVLRRGPAYSSELIKCLKDARLIVVEGTLYPLLSRMKKEGLLAYTWQESTAGPPRKYYSLTPAGGAALEQLADVWADMILTIEELSREE